jgi:CcmD family protein
LEVKSYEFLFWAYNVVWLGIAGFLLFLTVRLRRVNDRLERLEREIDDHGRGGS